MTIYLDHHATTPCDPRVVEAMLPYFTEAYGNASSRTHPFGWAAEEAVAKAREQVAALIGAKAKEIVFTSGATESDNLALFGYARQHRDAGRHLVVSAIEHKAVLDAADALEREGFEVTRVKPDPDGRVDPDVVEAALRKDTVLVALMLANNEVGAIQPVGEVGELCDRAGIALFTDAVQGIGRTPFRAAAVTLAAISGHKIYGPKGVGALFVRSKPKTKLAPMGFGGGHERGLRPGTLNVPGIVGLGRACELLRDEGEAEVARLRGLRDRLWSKLVVVDGVVLNGPALDGARLSHNLNFRVRGVEAESLILATQNEVALSSGSACTTQTLEPSYVLRAMGISYDDAHASVRVGVGRFNTEEEIDRAAEVITNAISELR